ncbi:ROK family transcriptional regulator [Mycobacterium sp. 21AC1]|uniref:ROK family protein n=1 Tax=[Mycobacterium] appelbergii TaxID=2939269 RepID=UPI0029392B9B|nr:ROK family protein [Mycobacterium sp. 21AC1]MDV3125306.1 ROK family transcriptional regulator [Mycobacterium sp. 21AC1]
MNQRVLLERLFSDSSATRPGLAQSTGLSLPTVIAALNDLEAVGLVRQSGLSEVAHGRPAATYEPNPDAGAVVGVDIGHEWLRLIVTDLTGGRLAATDIRNSATTALGLVDLTGSAVESIKSEAGIAAGALVHTVIGSPGVYDATRQRINYAANLPGWQRLGIAEALSAQLGSELTIDNDANLAAIGEHSYGAVRDIDNFVYITIGTGVGIGLFLNGSLYRGARGAAGEAGYLPLGQTLVPAPADRPPRGMLEEAIAADAVVAQARHLGMSEPLTAESVFNAARNGDSIALKVVEREAEQLAQLVASVLALFDPAVVVFGGGIGQNFDLMESTITTALRAISPMTAPLTRGALGQQAIVMGAVASGLEIARRHAFDVRTARQPAAGE